MFNIYILNIVIHAVSHFKQITMEAGIVNAVSLTYPFFLAEFYNLIIKHIEFTHNGHMIKS